MTMPWALSQSPLAAHHRASTGGARPAGGLAFAVVRLNSARVMTQSSALPPALRDEPAGRLLDDRPEREQCLLIERPADQLQAERQPLSVEAGRHHDARQ